MSKEDMIAIFKEKLGDLATDDFIEWLDAKGYFKAPAAKSHHGAYEGGLFDHSYEVAKQLANMTDKLGLEWERKESPWIVGLLHDMCKTDDYIKKETPWIVGLLADDDTKKDDNKYDYNNNKIIDGHGDKSLFLLEGIFNLTQEEAYCIRFHMGAFTDKSEWGYYSKAVANYPNVLYTHTADMIASQVIGI